MNEGKKFCNPESDPCHVEMLFSIPRVFWDHQISRISVKKIIFDFLINYSIDLVFKSLFDIKMFLKLTR